MRHPEENAAVAATCSGPDSGSGRSHVEAAQPRVRGDRRHGPQSIGGGHAVTINGGAATDGRCALRINLNPILNPSDQAYPSASTAVTR